MLRSRKPIGQRLRHSAMAWLFIGLMLACMSPSSRADQATEASRIPDGTRILTLERALELTRTRNPGLSASRYGFEASHSRERDAGKRLNPSLQLDVENWGGNSGNVTETTAGLRQTIELGGDRSARSALARAETEIAGAEVKQTATEVASEVTEDFLRTWQVQERLWQLRSVRFTAAEAVSAAGERLRAGAASAVERIRAEGSLATTEAEIDQAEGTLSAARRELALHWGESEASFDSLALASPAPTTALPAESLVVRVRSHPALLRAAALVQGERARVSFVRASRVPDLEGSAGVRQFSGTNGSQFVAGVGLPLPLWNARSGDLAASENELRRAEVQASALQLRLETAVQSAMERHLAARKSYERLAARAVPSANEALIALRNAYRAGRLSYVDLAEGQRAALEARLALIEATAEVWRTRGVLERLIGGSLPIGGDDR